MRKVKNDTVKKNRLKKLRDIAIIAVAVYILLGVTAYLVQGIIVFPAPKLSEGATAVSAKISNVENLELKMKDGNVLRGWFVKNQNSTKSNLLIYFGANGEELSNVIPRMSKFENWSIALINYRGYGASEGTPREEALFSDSLEIYDYFSKREDINSSNIVVMGRSIGTGVATYLASKRNAKSVILVSPYETLTSVAKEKCPIYPISLILKDKFDSLDIAPSVKVPVYILVGSEDKLIPVWHSKKLGEAWGGKVKFEEISGAGHNSIDDGDDYWKKVYDFLNSR